MEVNKISLQFFRISLGIVFIWFGLLKIFDVSPVIDIIQKALPSFLVQIHSFFILLGGVEVLIGLLLLMNRFIRFAIIIMTIHLIIATLSVLFTQGFQQRFLLLSLEGEFVIKNIF